MTPTPRQFPIVGLSGYKRSGKDAAARGLIGDGWVRASFADALRDFLYRLNPLVDADGGHERLAVLVDTHGWERCKDRYPEVRGLLERCGTDAGRHVLGEDVWVDTVMRKLPDAPVVFTDVRFPNEVAAISEAGGLIVRIDRPGFEAPPGSHISETALDDYAFDHRITNAGSLTDLRRAMNSAVFAAR